MNIRYNREMAKRAYGTHLYLIVDSLTGLCKLGRSMNVERRLKEHQRSNPWGDLRIVATFDGAGFLEPWVFRAMSSHERRGEWFRCTIAEALTAVGLVLL